MSLDVSLYVQNGQWDEWKNRKDNSIKEAGSMIGLIPIIEEYYEKYEPSKNGDEVFDANITHNLGKMASEAGIYRACWRPYELHPDFKKPKDYDAEMEFEESHPMFAKDIIPFLEKGYKDMEERPEHYKQFDSDNGWGLYIHFLPWVKKYLEACKKYPDAEIGTSR